MKLRDYVNLTLQEKRECGYDEKAIEAERKRIIRGFRDRDIKLYDPLTETEYNSILEEISK